MMTPAEKRPTRTQELLRLGDVPADKWPGMVARTITGLVFVLLGIALLVFMWVIFDRTEELSETLLIGGVALFGLGWKTVSGQIVDNAILSLRAPLQVIREFWKGGER